MTMSAALHPSPTAVRQTDSAGQPKAAAWSQASGRVIAISTRLAQVVADPAALVFLSQLIYWSRRGRDVQAREGWIFKTAAEWAQETGLSWKVQKRARQVLLAKGLVEERLQSMPARLEFRLSLPGLMQTLGLDQAEVGSAGAPAWSWIADGGERVAGGLAGELGRQFLLPTVMLARLPLPCALLASRLLPASLAMSLGPRVGVIANWHQQARYLRLHRQEWLGQTGLSRCQWQSARQHLLKLGLLQERQHNFPRRVDLALNLPALRGFLKQPVPCGQDREKQACEIVDSTEAAHSNRPIQPASLARSRLYPQVLQVLLPTTTEAAAEAQPPHLRPPGPNSLPALRWSQHSGQWPVPTQWRVWLEAKDSLEERPAEAGSLVWPPCFADGDQAVAMAHLGALGAATAQQILDEMAWQAQAKPIRSPLALLRTLAARAQRGEFVPDGAHRVRAQRDSGPRLQRVLRFGSEPPAESPKAARVTEPLSPEAQQAKAALRDMAQRFKRRSAG